MKNNKAKKENDIKNPKEKEVKKSKKATKEAENFRDFIIRFESFGNSIAFKYKENNEIKEITYEKYGKDIKALGTALIDMKVKRVVVIGTNSYKWCTTYLATTTAGKVIVPLDKALTDIEIGNLIKRSEADTIVYEKKYQKAIDEIIKKGCNLKNLICMDSKGNKEVLSYDKILEKGKEILENGDKRYEDVKVDSYKMSIMLFTSGTTNEPKAVMLSQNNIVSNIVAINRYVKLYKTDTLLSFLPIHHTFECTITFLYGVYSGSTVAFCEGLRYIQQNLKDFQVSVFVAVPLVLETMYKKIQKAIKEKGKTELVNKMIKISNNLLKVHIDIRKIVFKEILDNFGGHLRVVFYGAAPMNKDTIIGYNNLGIEQVQGYGLTETSPVISAETDKKKRPGSIGLVLDNLECRIDEPDKDGIGEITVKGPSVMLGYYKNEKATKEVLKNGWFSTGDYGYMDKDGFLYITGRKKDVIVLRNGENVYPQEIEALINKLEYVKESLVYQREQSKTDTMLCAKIVYDEETIKQTFGEKTEEQYKEEIWKQIKEINKNLPLFKHIKKIEITTEELEKTTTQKVKRYKELQKIK